VAASCAVPLMFHPGESTGVFILTAVYGISQVSNTTIITGSYT